MKPDAWRKLDRVFHSALQLGPAERCALLDKECVGDDQLRREVEALLAAHGEAGSFIERPALDIEARAVAEDQNQLSVGQSIGHYRIVTLLGSGGMGEVYLAEDTALGRKVALKLLPAEFTRDLDRVRRFQQEARAASALNHPNIITIHEITQVDDRHVIATEFIDGETLRERIRDARVQTAEGDGDKSGTALPLREVLNIAIQIADALAAAHEAGIVHRDIKPENIMVRRRDGYIKVLDFGLAKLTPVGVGGYDVDAEAATRPQVKTSAGLVMGTVTYMSPEQTRGEQVDARTDIWSLGVVLYELVAGRGPFDRPSPNEIIAAILNSAPPLLMDCIPEMPRELERIVGKALMKDREARYQTAKELLVDLRHLQHRLEIEKELDGSKSLLPQRESSGARQAMIVASAWEQLRRGITGHRRTQVIAAFALALLVLVIGTFIYRSYFRKNFTAIDSIAVLPLANVGSAPETEYLSDGITATLINSLSQLPQLRVVARPTAFRYKGKEIDPQQVGRDLGVQAIITGSLIQRDDVLTIQVDLVETNGGSQIWGRQYDRKPSDLLTVRQDLARDITERLRLNVGSEDANRLRKGDTGNTDAFRFYLRGLHLLNRVNAEDRKKAIIEFQQAINQDPNYALAYVGLADSYAFLETLSGEPAGEFMPKGRAAIDRALRIDDNLAEAHTSLGNIEQFSWNFSAAEREFRRGIELNPNAATGHAAYSFFLSRVQGRYNEALAEMKLAQQIDPLAARIGTGLAQIYSGLHELDAAIEEARKVIELEPGYAEAHRFLGVVYRQQARYEEAIKELETAVSLSKRQGWALSDLGVCYALFGKKAQAKSILNEIREKYDKREALGQELAYVYVAMGEKEQGFTWLEKDFQVRSSSLFLIAYSPRGDILREKLGNDRRWKDLLQRIGLPHG